MLLRKRFLSLFVPTLVLVVLIHEIWTTPIYTDRDLASMREAAVALAQQGDFETALERLRAMSEVAPNDRGVWGDYLSILIRSGNDDQALALYQQENSRALPDYTLAELFDAALRRRDAALARQIADREINQSRGDRDAIAAARARALNDSGLLLVDSEPAPQHAMSEESAAVSTSVSPTEPVLTQKKSNVVFNSPQKKLLDFRHHRRVSVAAAQQPGIGEATNSPHTQPTTVAPDASRSLAIEVRDAVRAAEQAPPEQRVAQAQAALPIIHEYVETLAVGSPAARNAMLDQVRALTLANRLDEAATIFETAGASDQLPFYGLMNGADLYSRRHEPERAAQLLDQAQRLQPDSREVAIAQFYNQLDLEQFDRAEKTLLRIGALSDSPQAQRDTKILTAMFAAYQNRLSDAQRQLEQLHDAAPNDPNIQIRLAQIYRWRGWPRRALVEYRDASHDGDSVPIQIGEIAALNDQHAFEQAHAQLRKLLEASPTHPEIIKAQQEQSAREHWDYSARVLTGHSSGSPVTGSGDIAFDQKLYAPPVTDQVRAFVHQRYDWANFPEGSGSANRLGIGGDYRSSLFDIAAEITDRIPGARLGATLSGEWKFDDRFSVFAEGQSDSDQIPLRALRTGIDGYSLAAGVLYRADESHNVRASYSRTEFSDGNDRDAMSAQYQQGVYRDARNQLSAIAQVYYSRNSAGNAVAYFNPDEETSIGVAARYDGILWRRYQRSWSQRVQLGVGNYSQQHFGNGAIWDVEYEQRWQLSDALNFNYGALYRSRIYDGAREGYSAIFGGINWRF